MLRTKARVSPEGLGRGALGKVMVGDATLGRSGFLRLKIVSSTRNTKLFVHFSKD